MSVASETVRKTPLTFRLDLKNIALPKFTEVLANVHGREVFDKENPKKVRRNGV